MRAIIIIIWIIDILNISFNINGVDIATFLDTTIQLNTVFWWLMWIFALGSVSAKCTKD